jgi:transcriptional regulator of acetoin/glycerol metabolism
VHDVDTLDTLGQLRLFEQLMDRSANQQIVSTASVPLLPLVEAGAFDRTLYYRLNTVYVRLQ